MDLMPIHKSLSDSHFNQSEIDNMLISTDTQFLYATKTRDDYKDTYARFTSDLILYLNKLPSTPAKKYVSELVNRDLVYLGINQIRKYEGFFSRVLKKDDVLNGIVLDVKELDISLDTGEAKNIDDCIYAIYFGFIRATVAINRMQIRNDKLFHEKMMQYLYLVLSRFLSTKELLPKQKVLIKIICYYTYYRYYLKERFPLTISIIEKYFTKEKEIFEEFKPRFKDIEKYTSIKDIPKMLIDSKVLIIDPNKFIIDVLKDLKQYGFYCIFGPLDMLTAYCITNKYPFDLFTQTGNVDKTLQTEIEDIMVKYMKKVKFSKDRV